MNETVERPLLRDIGYLTMQQWNRARWAYDYSMRFLPWLREAGYVRFEVEDIRVDSSGSAGIGIPPTKLAYMEISRLMNELNTYDDMESLAIDAEGHKLIVEFGKEMATAVSRWPMEERSHRVKAMRCEGCGELSMMYRPPRWEGDEIRVDCICGYVMDEDKFAWAATQIEKEERERQESLGRSRRSAA